MMRVSVSSALAVVGLAMASPARGANFLVEQLSFGHTGRINDRGQQTVPNFSLQGQPNVPEILSNKIILTPPAPGNARGAVWADNANKYKQWNVDVDFRVNGPEKGSGSLNVWLTRAGSKEVDAQSIDKVGRFDGLVLVLDRTGGGAGMVRGFLNDGSTDYKTHTSVDSLAFGHCDYAYRNRGSPSQIKINQSPNSFRVNIDGKLCFETDKISMPPGYTFGITATSADVADSHEVFKMVIMTEDLKATYELPPPSQPGQQNQKPMMQQQQQQQQQGQPRQPPPQGGYYGDGSEMADSSPDSITSSQQQFNDLHNRVQNVAHQVAVVMRTVQGQASTSERRHNEILEATKDLRAITARLDGLSGMQRQLDSVERELKGLRADVGQKIKSSENNIKGMLGEKHGSMMEHVAEQTSSRHGTLIFIIVGGQIVLIAGYIYYERKKTLPKKYL